MSDTSSIRSGSQNARGFLKKVKMGKKVERAFKGDKLPQTSEEAGDKAPETAGLTGQFATDFQELCRVQEINNPPPVLHRPKRPLSPGGQTGHESAAASGKRGADKKQLQVQQHQDDEELSPEDKEIIDLLKFKPKTFLVKCSLECLKPSIQVEMENPDKEETVTEIVIRGWLVEDNLLSIFRQCFTVMPKLHTLTFWRVGFTSERILELATILKQCESIKILNIDANDGPNPADNFHEFIREEMSIVKLRLRYCMITGEDCKAIGRQLGSLKTSNKKLISLDLSGNKIGDDGLCHIAKGLRTNRCLLNLSLSNNGIGDVGVKCLAQTVSKFPLSYDELIERRKIMSKNSSDRAKSLSPPLSRKGDIKERPGSVRSNDRDKSKGRDKSSKGGKKDAKAEKEEKHDKSKSSKKEDKPQEKPKKAANVSDSKQPPGKAKGAPKSGRSSKAASQLDQTDSLSDVETGSPLLEKAEYEEPDLVIIGNLTLILLNLARNKITDAGLEDLTNAVIFQGNHVALTKANGTGLMKIMLKGNSFNEESSLVYKKYDEIMQTRDPLYKPSVKSPDGDSAHS